MKRMQEQITGGFQRSMAFRIIAGAVLLLVLAALASVWAGLYLRKEVIRPIDAVSREPDAPLETILKNVRGRCQ